MDVNEAMGQLDKIKELTTNADHRTSARMYIRLIDGKLPYDSNRLMELINQAQEYIIEDHD